MRCLLTSGDHLEREERTLVSPDETQESSHYQQSEDDTIPRKRRKGGTGDLDNQPAGTRRVS